LALPVLAGLLLACGGGGGGSAPAPAPTPVPAPVEPEPAIPAPRPTLPVIHSFHAEPDRIPLGGQARLGFRFSHGHGRIAPFGPVTSGGSQDVQPRVDTSYTLIVTDAHGHESHRTVTVRVQQPTPPGPGPLPPPEPGPTPPPSPGGGPAATTPRQPVFRAPAFLIANSSSRDLISLGAVQPGVTYHWTCSVPGALETSPSDSIVFVQPGPPGNLTLTCYGTDAAGQRGLAASITLPVTARPPSLPITAAEGVLLTRHSYTARVALPAGSTCRWEITHGRILSPLDQPEITFSTEDTGLVRLLCWIESSGAGPQALPSSLERQVAPADLADASAFFGDGLPFLQLGPEPSPRSLSLVWLARGDRNQDWAVDVLGSDGRWDRQFVITHHTLNLPSRVRALEPVHRIYTTPLRLPAAGAAFCYRVRLDGQVVFQSRGMALKAPGQKQVVAIAGNLAGSGPATALDRQILAQHPDLLLVPGNLVTLGGHAEHYRHSLFARFNGDPSAQAGPLLRQIPLVGCLGSQDTDRVLEPAGVPLAPNPASPQVNGLAYYYYFNQPLNGPMLALNLGPGGHVAAAQTPYLNDPIGFWPMLDASRERYRRMGNFSFTSGDVHWLVLDSNYYMDWSRPELQQWLEADLRAATSTWKIAVFNYPVYTHSTLHPDYREQEGSRMRQLWPIFRRNGVDLTLSAHLPSYQRSRPLDCTGPATRTAATAVPPGYRTLDDAGLVEDASFTGAEPTAAQPQPPLPQGIISIISGAGAGATLQPGQVQRPAGSHPEPLRFEPGRHSFSLLETEGGRLTFRQLDEHGAELDRFTVIKP
jgi:hypothetical protein